MEHKSSKPKLRRYQDIWERLKSQAYKAAKPDSGAQPQLRIECSVKHWRTIRKAVQKEKYQDDNFRIRYQYAQLSFNFIAQPSEITGILVCRLELNERPTLDMFTEVCTNCRGSGVVPVASKTGHSTVACPVCHPYGLKENL